ncbi:MAG: hypothetical protein KFW21_06580 [Spirochaetota bacterium]|nr:hypothetical protein [Spirochaetota bacterium]
MSIFRFFFVLTILMFYGLLFTEQRIVSRERMRETIKLTQEIEQLNARKQELTILIEIERSRLVKRSQNMGKLLSPRDIIIVE